MSPGSLLRLALVAERYGPASGLQAAHPQNRSKSMNPQFPHLMRYLVVMTISIMVIGNFFAPFDAL